MSDGLDPTAILRAQAGDSAAFGEVFRATEPDVARLCRRLLGPGAAAEDAVTEVFLRARRGLTGYDRKRPFRSWLLAVASHHCIDQLRRRNTEARIFEPRDVDTETLSDPGPSPLAQLVGTEEHADLLAAIDALPPRYRVPLVLRYFDDQSYDEIAEALEIERAQVATLLFRARRRLRDRFAAGAARVVPLRERSAGRGEGKAR